MAISDSDLARVWKMAFVTKLMQQSYMSEKSCKALVRRICDAKSDADTTTKYQLLLRKAVEDLRFAGFEIKTVLNPADQLTYVGLVNILPDETSKIASPFSIPQREYFRTVLEYIATSTFEAERGPSTPCSPESELLHLELPQPEGVEAPVKKMSKSEKQDTLNELKRQGWLSTAPGREGHLSLGPRSFLELSQLLLSFDNLTDATRAAWEQLV